MRVLDKVLCNSLVRTPCQFHNGILVALAGFGTGARAVGWTGALGAAVAAAWYFAPRLDARRPLRSKPP